MEIPIAKVIDRFPVVDGKEYHIEYKLLDTSAVLGYLNDRLYTDVNSYAVIDISADGKNAKVVQVEIPLAKSYNPTESKKDGVPEGITVCSDIIDAKFRYGHWTIGGKKTKITKISQYCGYHYDLSF